MTDKDTVNRILEYRSEDAFRELYRSKTPALYRMALRLTGGDVAVAEDLVQEMWCVAIRKLAQFQWKSELKTWLTAILINLSKQHYRDDMWIETADIPANTAVSSFDPQSIDLERAIDSLPPGYRQIVLLHDIEGYKHHEIADMLGISEGTSKSQLAHARESLRQFLKK